MAERKLRVFPSILRQAQDNASLRAGLCHVKEDKPTVRELYRKFSSFLNRLPSDTKLPSPPTSLPK